MTTIQDRILENFDKKFPNIRCRIDKKDTYYCQDDLKQFIIQSIKEVQEETRKETIDKYFLDAEKRLSITNKEKQNV